MSTSLNLIGFLDETRYFSPNRDFRSTSKKSLKIMEKSSQNPLKILSPTLPEPQKINPKSKKIVEKNTRWLQMRQKITQERPKRRPKAPKSAQDPPKSPKSARTWPQQERSVALPSLKLPPLLAEGWHQLQAQLRACEAVWISQRFFKDFWRFLRVRHNKKINRNEIRRGLWPQSV